MVTRSIEIRAALICAMVGGWLSAQSASWTDYRGPETTGFVPSCEVPLVWGEDRNIAWKVKVPGRGWSSPMVENGKIWMTTATEDGKKMHVLAVDAASGGMLHSRVLFENEKPANRNALNSYASPTVALERGRVYVHFGTYGTACLDTDSGKVIWQRRDLHCDHLEGPGSSPILFEDLLIFHLDGADVQFVVALDKATGETRWRTDRSIDLSKFQPDLRKAYSTPLIVHADGKPLMISSGAQATFAYDPITGQEQWFLRHPGFSMSSRPVAGDGMIYVSTGFARAQLYAVRASGKGEISKSDVAWIYSRNVPKMPSPVLHEDRIYMINDGGFVTCLDVKDGSAVWRHRVGGEHSASPLCIGDRIYLFDREGTSTVIERGDAFRELAKNVLDDGCMATPAVLGDSLVIRTRSHLYRIAPTK